MKSLEWEELLPGTPCVVLTRFNPLDVVNDGIARELTEVSIIQLHKDLINGL